MRGKTVDVDFMAKFIQECCESNKTSSQDIALEAKSQINEIDIQIKNIENLKSKRSKLINVVNFLVVDESESDKEASFAKNNALTLEFSKEICALIEKSGEVTVSEMLTSLGESNKGRIFLAIKRLSEMGVVSRNAQSKAVIQGPQWRTVIQDVEPADVS